MQSEERCYRAAAPEDDHHSSNLPDHNDTKKDIQKEPALRVKLEKAHILYRLYMHMEIAIETESSIGIHCEQQRELAMSLALRIWMESKHQPGSRLYTGPRSKLCRTTDLASKYRYHTEIF